MGYQWRGKVNNTPRTLTELNTFDQSACGTYAGFSRHRKARTPVCGPCKDANKAYRKAWYRAHNPIPERSPFDPSKCGSVAGYKRHTRYGNDACDPCQHAYKQYQRNWRSRKAAA